MPWPKKKNLLRKSNVPHRCCFCGTLCWRWSALKTHLSSEDPLLCCEKTPRRINQAENELWSSIRGLYCSGSPVPAVESEIKKKMLRQVSCYIWDFHTSKLRNFHVRESSSFLTGCVSAWTKTADCLKWILVKQKNWLSNRVQTFFVT